MMALVLGKMLNIKMDYKKVGKEKHSHVNMTE